MKRQQPEVDGQEGAEQPAPQPNNADNVDTARGLKAESISTAKAESILKIIQNSEEALLNRR